MDYAQIMDTIINGFRTWTPTGPMMLDDKDVKRVLNTIHQAEAAGPVFHPSEFIKAGDGLERQKRLVNPYQYVQAELKEIFPADNEILGED